MKRRRRRGAKTPELNRDEMITLYDGGMTLIDMSVHFTKKFGQTVTYDQIRYRLRNLGVEIDGARSYNQNAATGRMPKPLMSEGRIASIYDGRIYLDVKTLY